MNLRRNFERFCYRNRNKGIPNLMLYIVLGTAIVYFVSMVSGNTALYYFLAFDRNLILHGQIWRLFTYPLTSGYGQNLLFLAIMLMCYYSIGQAMENMWGTCRFNLFYLSGMLMMDIYSMIFGTYADATYLNLSLLLSYATLYPDAQFLLFFIIPIKAWFLALFNMVTILFGVFTSRFPYNLFPLIALANYFLFFGKDVLNVIPLSWQMNFRRMFKKSPHAPKKTGKAKVIPFPTAGSYEASTKTPEAPYTHKCTVCGRTDVTNPELEFRYCSKCKGYHCYCEDHINNHVHIQ